MLTNKFLFLINVLLIINHVISTVLQYSSDALADQIVNLPGTSNLDIKFNQFSGYLNIPGSSGSDTKFMHYWLVESMSDPVNDPIAFWTNGGPGCSGLLGFFTEQGPFRPNKDLSLSMNPYAWNTIANMVFIESPCGVGFSYSDDDNDYKTDDVQTATDNYALIQAFFDRFPQFLKNDLYITSESYGGHYMPTLAKYIVDQNTASNQPLLNFKGFAVGNPATTFYSAIPASMETYWGHQLISKPLWDKFEEYCTGPNHAKNFAKCEDIYLKMYIEVGDLNPYALDYPVCTEDDVNKQKGRSQRTWFINHMLGAMKSFASSSTKNNNDTTITSVTSGSNSNSIEEFRKALKLEPVEGYEPCADNYMTSYLAQASVKQAMHVNTAIEWSDCSRTLRYKQSDGKNDMTPYYNYLIDGNYGLNILVYSGDDDDVCATVGTQSWIWDLGYELSGNGWDTYLVADQTAGYISKWKNTKLAFATVHGAGHEVPTYKPEVALFLWKSYLKGDLTNA